MKRLISGAIANSPAMNTLMVGILVLGTFSFAVMRREVFPEFQLEIVLVSVPYPGCVARRDRAWDLPKGRRSRPDDRRNQKGDLGRRRKCRLGGSGTECFGQGRSASG